MSKISKLMAATLMMAAVAGAGAGDRSIYDTGTRRRYRGTGGRELTEEEKARNHQMYGVNMQEHEFIIHGEKIMARNKKTAMKIYANRHKK